MPLITHPIVRAHPVTGRKALYAVSGSSFGIVGMPEDEAVDLLDELAAHATQARVPVQPSTIGVGDVVVWDNASLLHSATLIDPDDPRTLWRITIKEPALAAAECSRRRSRRAGCSSAGQPSAARAGLRYNLRIDRRCPGSPTPCRAASLPWHLRSCCSACSRERSGTRWGISATGCSGRMTRSCNCRRATAPAWFARCSPVVRPRRQAARLRCPPGSQMPQRFGIPLHHGPPQRRPST